MINWATTPTGETNPGAAPNSLTDDWFFNVSSLNNAQTMGLNGSRSVLGITFNSTGTTNIENHTSSGTSNILTISTGGVTVNSGAGAVSLGSNGANRGFMNYRIAGNQSWRNNSANVLTVAGSITNTANLAPYTLTLGGSGAGGVSVLNAITDGGTTGTLALSINSTGGGVVSLSGANTFTGGVNVSNGTLRLGNNAALGGSAGAVVVSSGGTLDLNGRAVANTNALTLSGTGVSSGGALSNGSSTSASYAGLVTLGGSASIVAGSGDITLGNAGTITGSGFNLTVGGARNTTIASVIGTGSGGLTKQNSGVLTLNAANTFTGLTTISAGTLALGSSGSLAGDVNLGTSASRGTLNLTAKSAYAFGTGQTLSGDGTVNIGAGNTVTLNGAFSPGNSAGLVSVTGNLALGNAATLGNATGAITTMELAGSGGVGGVDFDQVAVSGQLTFGGTLAIIAAGGYNINQTGSYQLFTFGGRSGAWDFVTVGGTMLNNSGGVWTGDASGFSYTFTESLGDLVVSAIPEPGAFALLGGFSAFGFAGLRRRRRAV